MGMEFWYASHKESMQLEDQEEKSAIRKMGCKAV
jgi:hypothetical protein